VKTELMPNFDFDAYNHDQVAETEVDEVAAAETEAPVIQSNSTPSGNGLGSAADAGDEVDKW
jgi:hypothetical protein